MRIVFTDAVVQVLQGTPWSMAVMHIDNGIWLKEKRAPCGNSIECSCPFVGIEGVQG